MAKPFKNLWSKMSPEARKQVKERAEALVLALDLEEQRQRCSEPTAPTTNDPPKRAAG